MVITMPRILQDKLGYDGADALIATLNQLENSHRETTLDVAENKFEKRLIEETSKLENKIENIRVEIINVQGNLEVKIAQAQSNLTKWIFIFIVGQFWAIIGVVTGILFAFFRK